MDLTSVVPNTKVQGFMAIIALVANVICLSVIIKRAIEQKKNPYKNEIFTDTKDFQEAMARARQLLELCGIPVPEGRSLLRT